MSHYICRLIDPDGTVQSVVPIIGSSVADAVAIAQSHFRARGGKGAFELWKGNTRIVTHGEEMASVAEPHLNPIKTAGC
jgi:hypothetical protein